MRKLLCAYVVGALLAVCGASVHAGDTPTITSAGESVGSADCMELNEQGLSPEELAQRGCCSWHKGVCGCSNGRVRCCDGTLSPSCTCATDSPSGRET